MRIRTCTKIFVLTLFRALVHIAEKLRVDAVRIASEQMAKEKEEDCEETVQRPPVAAEVIVRKLRSLNELCTSSLTIQSIINGKVRRSGRWRPRGTSKLLFVALGEVRAGIDLSNISENCVQVDSTVHLRLPHPRILSAYVDVDRSYSYDVRRSNIFAPDTGQLHLEAQQRALRQIEQEAVELGILQDAQRNAEEVLKNLLKPFTDLSVAVEFD